MIKKNVKWVIIGFFVSIIMGVAIADAKWTYLLLLLAPLLVYLAVKQPFLFPFGAYAALICFDSVLSVEGESQGATLTRYLGLLSILVFFLKGSFEKRLKEPNPAVLWWILFAAYGALSMTWAIETELVLSSIFTHLALLFLYLFAVAYKTENRDYKILTALILIGGILASMTIIYNYSHGEFYRRAAGRASILVGDRTTGPNRLAFDLLIPFSIAFSMAVQKKAIALRSLSFVAVLLIIVGITLTGSRGGLVGAGVIVTVYILSVNKKLGLAAFVALCIVVLLPYLPEIYGQRMHMSFGDGGAGRSGIWLVGLKALKKYWFLGAGQLNFSNAYDEFITYVSEFHGFSRAPHNLFLGIFVELGIVGILLLILAMRAHYKLLKKTYLRNENSLMLKAAFWGMLASSLFTDSALLKSFWLLWTMILVNDDISRDRAKQLSQAPRTEWDYSVLPLPGKNR